MYAIPQRPIAMRALRRRSAVERRVLMLVRGDVQREAPELPADARRTREPQASSPSSQDTYFTELRRVATAFGVAIQPPDVPYVSSDELLLMGWIAQAQRVVNPAIAMPDDPILIAAVARCAGLLDAMGLRLGPLTIFVASQKGRSIGQ